jgi:hypothetical protein
VRAPKTYFYDTGLACFLLGIRAPDQLEKHPLRGAIFENWVVTEILKSRTRRALPPGLHFFRSRAGLEVDVLVDAGTSLLAAEVKAGQTVAGDYFGSLEELRSLVLAATPAWRLRRRLVYGGETARRWRGVDVVPWSRVADLAW